MPYSALFVGWGEIVRGREQLATQVFGETVEYWQRLQQEGAIESFEPVFLEPHGGDLQGFFLVRGTPEQLGRVRTSDEFFRVSLRASQVIDGLGVVGASVGPEIEQNMSVFAEVTGALGSG